MVQRGGCVKCEGCRSAGMTPPSVIKESSPNPWLSPTWVGGTAKNTGTEAVASVGREEAKTGVGAGGAAAAGAAGKLAVKKGVGAGGCGRAAVAWKVGPAAVGGVVDPALSDPN